MVQIELYIMGVINGIILFLEKLLIKIKLNIPNILKIIFTCFIIFNLWLVLEIPI